MEFVILAVLAAIVLGVALKVRNMPNYKIVPEKDAADGVERWFPMKRKGLGYQYIKMVKDLPGYENDIFETSKTQMGGQENSTLAKKIIENHRLTTINGIEIEGE